MLENIKQAHRSTLVLFWIADVDLIAQAFGNALREEVGYRGLLLPHLYLKFAGAWRGAIVTAPSYDGPSARLSC